MGRPLSKASWNQMDYQQQHFKSTDLPLYKGLIFSFSPSVPYRPYEPYFVQANLPSASNKEKETSLV